MKKSDKTTHALPIPEGWPRPESLPHYLAHIDGVDLLAGAADALAASSARYFGLPLPIPDGSIPVCAAWKEHARAHGTAALMDPAHMPAIVDPRGIFAVRDPGSASDDVVLQASGSAECMAHDALMVQDGATPGALTWNGAARRMSALTLRAMDAWTRDSYRAIAHACATLTADRRANYARDPKGYQTALDAEPNDLGTAALLAGADPDELAPIMVSGGGLGTRPGQTYEGATVKNKGAGAADKPFMEAASRNPAIVAIGGDAAARVRPEAYAALRELHAAIAQAAERGEKTMDSGKPTDETQREVTATIGAILDAVLVYSANAVTQISLRAAARYGMIGPGTYGACLKGVESAAHACGMMLTLAIHDASTKTHSRLNAYRLACAANYLANAARAGSGITARALHGAIGAIGPARLLAARGMEEIAADVALEAMGIPAHLRDDWRPYARRLTQDPGAPLALRQVLIELGHSYSTSFAGKCGASEQSLKELLKEAGYHSTEETGEGTADE